MADYCDSKQNEIIQAIHHLYDEVQGNNFSCTAAFIKYMKLFSSFKKNCKDMPQYNDILVLFEKINYLIDETHTKNCNSNIIPKSQNIQNNIIFGNDSGWSPNDYYGWSSNESVITCCDSDGCGSLNC